MSYSRKLKLHALITGCDFVFSKLTTNYKLSNLDFVTKKWIKFFLNNSQIIAEGMTEVGDPKVAICNAVDKLNIQLLVVGSHGRGAVTRFASIYVFKNN